MDNAESTTCSPDQSPLVGLPPEERANRTVVELNKMDRRAFYVARAVLHDSTLAEDAIQESKIAVYRRSLKESIENLPAYYLRTVNHTAISIARKRASRLRVESNWHAAMLLGQKMSMEECCEKLQLLQDYLDDHHAIHAQTLYAMLNAHGQASEAAEVLGITVPAIRGRFHRLIQYVHNHLVSISEWLGEDYRDDDDGSAGPPAKRKPKDPKSGPNWSPLTSRYPTGTSRKSCKLDDIDSGEAGSEEVRREGVHSDSKRNDEPAGPENDSRNCADSDIGLVIVRLCCALEQLGWEVLGDSSRVSRTLTREAIVLDDLWIEFELSLAANEVARRADQIADTDAVLRILDFGLSTLFFLDFSGDIELRTPLLPGMRQFLQTHLKPVITEILIWGTEHDHVTEVYPDFDLNIIDQTNRSKTNAIENQSNELFTILSPNAERSGLFSWVSKMSQARKKHEKALDLLAALYRLLPDECEKVFNCWNELPLGDLRKLPSSPGSFNLNKATDLSTSSFDTSPEIAHPGDGDCGDSGLTDNRKSDQASEVSDRESDPHLGQAPPANEMNLDSEDHLRNADDSGEKPLGN